MKLNKTNMRKLYIEFTRPVTSYKRFPIFSWLIRYFEDTEYSHVRLTWVNSTGRKLVYEASGSSVKFIGPRAQENKPVQVLDSFEIDVSSIEYRRLIDMCMEYADISYGIIQVIGIALTYTPWFSKNPFSDGDKTQICSEIVSRILKEVKGVKVTNDFDNAGPRAVNQALTRLVDSRADFRKGHIS